MTAPREHRGWHVPRGLPHFDTPEIPQFVTFRTADLLPRDVALARVGEGDEAHRRRIEAVLDSGAGACPLVRAEIAQAVVDALLHGAGDTHDMHAFVVMPNHVHVLTVLREGCRLADVVGGWKSVSSRRILAILHTRGAFWQREYFDRYIRDEDHFERVRAYIENNPVTAGLARLPQDWKFSSAGVRERS